MKLDHLLTASALTLVFGGIACRFGDDSVPAPDLAAPAAVAVEEPAAVFEADGSLVRPRGYRRWIFVGAPLTPNDMNDGHAAFPEFHGVYVDPGSYDHFKETGKWRDGTVMVKELSTVGAKSSTSGKGYFMGRFTGVEVSVKDSTRFRDQPGHWAFFRFTDEAGGPVHRRAKALPADSCAACHKASADDDSVFTQHYPVLRAAKSFGKGEPEDR